MKCVILHESNRRMRVRIPSLSMSFEQADLIEYYMRSIEGVKSATVYERTNDAVILFKGMVSDYKDLFIEKMAAFDDKDEEIRALVPDETGRKLNRDYEEKIVFRVCNRVLRKIFLPLPIATAWTFVSSLPFLYKGLKSLLSGKLEVSVLDAAALSASMLRGDFTTASSVMFLLHIGEDLEEWTKKKSIGDLARSMSLGVDKVWRLCDGKEVSVNIRSMEVGDRYVVRNSDIIPLDGKVVSGMMTVNQSAMTGESEPVMKETDSYVYAGTVVNEGECVVEVTKAAGTGKYDQIVKMIEDSERLKSNTEAKAYRLADRLVPYSFAGSILTYLLTRNVNRALSFLMVDYSCAMKLSMPLSVLTAIREARENDVSVKGGKFMEAVADADTIVFDKTGTLTHANPKLADIYTFEDRDPDEMLRIAACIEEHFPHSVANAVVQAAHEKGLDHDEMHSKVEYIVAHGVSSFIGEEKILVGSYHFVIEDEHAVLPDNAEEILDAISPEYSRLFMAIGGRLAAVMCISDPLREEAADVVQKLHELGITKVCMMTGDNLKNAKAVAKRLSLDEFHAEVLPEDKAAFIRSEHEKGRKVIMVGDGVNDTPALSEADVGIAISDGAAIAREVADITISADDLTRVVFLRELSMALMERIRGNYKFIVDFNSLLILLGVAGILPPASSALLHNSTTIITGLKSMTNLIDEKKEGSPLS